MADDLASKSELAQAFERKIELSKWALVFEQLWPRLWLIVGIAGLFIIFSLLGVWPLLGEVGHRIALTAFAIALLAALIFAGRVRYPSRDEAIRRIERVSGQPHRPASSWEDTLSSAAPDTTTMAIWQAHRARMAAALERLKVGRPRPRTDRYDPFALRSLLFLGVVMLLGLVGQNSFDRLKAAFNFGTNPALLNARLDAWITPPSYTLRAPIMLADGAHGDGIKTADSSTAIEVPEKSALIVRASGMGGAQLALDVAPLSGKPERLLNERPKAAGDILELRFIVTKPGVYRILADGSELGRWTLDVTPDLPPKISLSKAPERTPRGSMKLTYKVSDDYGVVSANAKLKRLEPKPGDASKAWAQPPALKGPRLPLEQPPQLVLRLPPSKNKEGEAFTYLELGPHAWAGMPVTLALEAHDAAGNTGRTARIEMVLPERQFRKPLARAIIEQRRKLLQDSRTKGQVLTALDALTMEPEGFIDDAGVYLGLRFAYRSLQSAKTRGDYRNVTEQLWHVALKLEDGNLSDAERAMRDAQEKLSQALENGASDEEIQKLMQELRQALNQYMEQLARQSEGQDKSYSQGTDEQNQTINQQDLERMMRNIEEMAKNGSREQAQQMLSELRDLMERMQAGRTSEEDRQNAQMMMKKLEELGNVASEQQKLMDETFNEGRRQGQQGQQEGQPGQPGQRGQKGQGQQRSARPGQQGQKGQGQQGQGEKGERGQQGQGQDGMQGEGSGQGQLTQRQRELRDRLSRLQQELRERGMGSSEQLDEAGQAMEGAEQALEQGDFEGATNEQARALEQMRQGAQNMAQEMMKQMPSRQGQAGDAPRDPMGRPQRSQGPDLGTSVKVPDEIDMQRARQILEELRRRLGEQTRPPAELDYLERLLRRF